MTPGPVGHVLALEYALAADQDLDAIADFYESENAWQAALDVPDRIREAARLICHMSREWLIGISSVQEYVLTDLPFRIAYKMTRSQVRILCIKHTAQQWP